MIISIDGYDGTGKTTLAKKIEKERDFMYIEKPFIRRYMEENNCTINEAIIKVEEIEKKLHELKNRNKIIDFYLSALEWVETKKNERNIVLDRGILTSYAVYGNKETLEIYKKYLEKGIFYDKSIYLVADDYERRRRIILNDPNDPDLKYPIKWRTNDLENFAKVNNLNYSKIITDNKSKEEVQKEALIILDKEISENYEYNENKVLVKRMR